MSNIKPATFLFAALLLTAPAMAQTTGKLSLTKGQKLQVDNVVKSVINQEMMGQSIEITIDANVTHKVEVKEKKDTAYHLSSTMTHLVTNANAMGQTMAFDSDKPEDLQSETGKALQDQLNVAREVTISEKARVISAPSPEKKAPSGNQLMDMVNSATGADTDESNGASAAFELLPAGKKVGDSWSDSTITEELKTYRNYTLKSITGNEATLALDGKQVTHKKVEQQGMEITVNMEGKLTGEGIVDVKTGVLKQRTVLLDGTGTAEVMGQSIPVTTKTTTTTTVKGI